MTRAKRGDWQRLEHAQAARDQLHLRAVTAEEDAGTRRYRGWQRALSAFVAAALFVGPITVTVESGHQAAGVLAAGSHRIDDDAWQAIQDIASLRFRFAMNAVHAAPIVDPAAPLSFQPKITQSTGAGGGVPVVNITAPNAAGISLNQYQSFNIDAIGLILNNSLQSGTSLTGGTVAANPNLNGRTASVILNQVTSTGAGYASVLAGPLEVFGAPATVIIANPNGIAVRGAGFTNTIGVTLTTGTPQFLTGNGGTATDFANATAVGYDVRGGHIQIEGNAGVNGPGSGIEGTVGTIDMIGETVGINAPLYAGTRINVIAGDQFVMPATVDSTGTTYSTQPNGSANASAAVGGGNQTFAIDATAFGAMTAGQISMVGTTAGMGVRVDGALAATAGNLTLSSNGDLTVTSHTAQQDVSITSAGTTTLTGTGVAGGNYRVNAAGDVVSEGTVQAGGDLSFAAGNNLTVSGQATAQSDVTLQVGRNVALTGSLASGKAFGANVSGAFEVAGSLLIGTDATLASGSLNVPGVVIVQQNGTFNVAADITGSGSIAFGQSGALTSGHDVLLTGKLLSNDLRVDAANSAAFADVQAGGAFAATARGGDVTFNGNAAAVGNTAVQAANDVVVSGVLAGGAGVALSAQRNVTVAASGTVQSVGDLSMNAVSGDVSALGTLTSAAALGAHAGHNVVLNGATSAVGDTTLDAVNDVTVGSTLAVQGNGTVTAGHDIALAGTSGFAKDVTATAGHDLSVAGSLQGNGVKLTAANAVTLNDVQANGALSIASTGSNGGIVVNGTVASLSDGTVHAANTVAVNGTLKTAGALDVTAGADTSIAGNVTSNGDMNLRNTVGSLTSTGQIQSGGNLAVDAAQTIDLGTGATSALGDIGLTAGRDVIVNGTLVAQGNGTISAGNAIAGNAALAFGLAANLHSTGDTALTGSLRGATIQTNAGGSGSFANVQAGSTIAMSATGDLALTGTLVGGATASLTAGRDVSVAGTSTVTLDTTIQGGRDVNVTGTVNGQGNGLVVAGRDITGNGTLAFEQAAVLNAGRNVVQGGLVQGNTVQVTAGSDVAVNNAQSASGLTLSAGTSGAGNLTVNGSVSAAQAITATAFGNVAIGNAGKLAAGSTLGVGALNDIVNAGVLESTGDMTLNARLGSLDATGGINSGGLLTITTGLDLSLGVSTTSVGAMTLAASRNVVLNGTLVGESSGSIGAGQDILGAGTQSFASAALVSAQRDIALTGSLQANAIQAKAGNSATLHDVVSSTTLDVTANGNAAGGDVSITGNASAAGAVTVNAARDVLVQGSVGSNSTVGLTATRNVTVTGGLQSIGDLTVTARRGNALLNGTATTSGALKVVSGADTQLGGTTNAGGNIDVEATGNIALTGSLAGQGTGVLSAGNDITGAGAAAFAQAATVVAAHDTALTGSLQGAAVKVVAGNNARLGTVQAMTGNIDVTAYGLAGEGDLTVGGTATAFGAVSLAAARDVNVAGAINSLTATTIGAGRNLTTGNITAGSDVELDTSNGTVIAGDVKTNGNLWVDAGGSASLGNVQAAGVVAMDSLGIDGVGDIDVRGGLIAGGATVIDAARDAHVAANLTTGGGLTVSAGRNVSAGGAVAANADMNLTASNGNLSVGGMASTVGNLNAKAGGSLSMAGSLVNGNTTLSSGGAMTLTNGLFGLGSAMITSGGAIAGGGSLTFAGDIVVSSGAGIALGGVQGAGLFKASAVGDMSFGATTAVGNVTAKSTSGSVAFNGQVQSGGAVDIEAARNASVTGGIASTGNVTVSGGAGNVSVAGVSANGDVAMTAGQTLTLSGSSVVAGEVVLNGGNVTLTGSTAGSKNIAVTASGNVDTSQASIVSTKDLQVSGANVTLGNAIVGGALNAQATNQLSLKGSAVDVVGNATFVSQNGFSNAGSVLAGGALTVSAANVTNAANASLASTSTTTITATNFTNAGLVNGKTTKVTVAGALSNVGGALMGLDGVTINTGTLDNRNGLIFAGDPNTTNAPTTGDVSLTINGGGSAFNNASGQLLAQRNMGLSAVNAALDPSLGTISQGGQLSITAGQVNVSGAWYYGGTGVTVNALSGMTNSGTIDGTAPLVISTGGTFTNSGQVIGQDVTFNGTLINAANAVVHAGNVLALNGNMTNRGTVEAATAINVSGGSYDNQAGLTQSQGNIGFNLGGTLQNTGGNIFAGNDISIAAAAVVNDQTAPTSVVTTAAVPVDDPSLLMSTVVGQETYYVGFSSESGLNVDQYVVTATLGDLLAPTGNIQYFDIGYPKSQPVATSGNVSFVKTAQMSTLSSNTRNPTYETVWLLDTGDVNSSAPRQTLTLPMVYRTVSTQQLGTSGVISAGGNISLSAGALSNQGGQISAGGSVSLNIQSLANGAVAPTLTSQVIERVDQTQLDAFVSALRAMEKTTFPSGLIVASTLNSYQDSMVPSATFSIASSVAAPIATGTTLTSSPTGIIAACGNMTIAGGTLTNAGQLYAGNNLLVTAQQLVNQGGNQQQFSSSAGCVAGVSSIACNETTSPRGNNPTTTTFSYTQNNATIFAGNDLVIAAGQVDNTYGNLLAGHDIVIGGVGTTTGSTTPAQSLNNTSGNIVAGNNVTLNISGAVTNKLPSPVTVHQSFGSVEQYSGCMTAGGYKESYCEGYVDQQSGSSSVISAGNNLQITAGSLTNIGSLIAAGNNATIAVAGPVINEAQTLNAYWHSHWVQETGMFSSDKRHDIWACGSAAECTALYGSAYTSVGGTIDPPQPIGNIAATIQAPNLSISSNGQIQNVGNVLGTSVSLTGQKLINGITTANTYTPRVNAPSQVISLSPLTLPGLNLSTPRTSAAVLTSVAGQASYVDTPIGGTSQGQFSPQVLLDNLPSTLQPSSTLFYYNPQEEDLMLQQAALQQTGKASFVDGLAYDSKTNLSVTEQEKAYLYGNALDYAKQNNLQLGQALTQAQVGALDKPMLWYVEQTVPDPSCQATGVASCPTITALMPQVYLPSTTSALSAGGNIIGQDVTLNFEGSGQGSILNTGNISASGTLTVNTPTLTNQANEVNVGQIWSKVKGGYVDTTGTVVQPGGFMSAANMDLNVQTLSQIGGALQKLTADGQIDEAGTQQLTAALTQQLGGNFTQMTLADHLHTDFVKEGGSFGMEQLIGMVAAVALSVMMGPETFAMYNGLIDPIMFAAISPTLGVLASAAATGLAAATTALAAGAVSQVISTGSLDLKQVLEGAAITGLTAGLTQGLLGSTGIMNWGGGVTQASSATTLNNLGTTAENIAGQALIGASVQTAIAGGSFGSAFLRNVEQDTVAVGANEIGSLSQSVSWMAEGTPMYILTHSALGCAGSAVAGTGCESGAIGGAVSAAFSPDFIKAIDPTGAQLSSGQQAAL
ncbi:filamentous hemagglutinin N-terminal domain-containing protein, partial [Trinickia caryophylli]